MVLPRFTIAITPLTSMFEFCQFQKFVNWPVFESHRPTPLPPIQKMPLPSSNMQYIGSLPAHGYGSELSVWLPQFRQCVAASAAPLLPSMRVSPVSPAANHMLP